MPEVIEVKGLERIKRNLDKLPTELSRAMAATMDASLLNLKGPLAYPPTTEANRPKHGTWGPYYERGIGSAYKQKRDGSVTQYKNSERLSANWATKVTSGPFTLTGEVGNKASYAPDVHTDALQPDIFGARGWKTVETAVKEERAGIVRLFENTISKVLKRLGW